MGSISVGTLEQFNSKSFFFFWFITKDDTHTEKRLFSGKYLRGPLETYLCCRSFQWIRYTKNQESFIDISWYVVIMKVCPHKKYRDFRFFTFILNINDLVAKEGRQHTSCWSSFGKPIPKNASCLPPKPSAKLKAFTLCLSKWKMISKYLAMMLTLQKSKK